MMAVTMRIKARMRPALVALLLLAACSSSAPQTSGPKAKVAQPQFSIDQLFGPSDAGFPVGPYEVQYRVEIANRADVSLTLKRITISTVNPEGGAYALTAPHDYYFNKEIPARASDAIEFWAKAYGYGRSMRDTEPVTIKGVAYFQASSGGYLNQVFIRELPQLR
jgi:hypothetical protein